MDTSFCLHPVVLRDNIVPCGSCPVCRMKYRKQMAVRLYMEKSIEKPPHSFFVTLTYNDESIPTYKDRKCFDKEHCQTFFDSLRHAIRPLGYTLRYFLTCEYGEEGYRPHYHFIALLYSQGSSKRLGFKSFLQICERIWHKGFVYLGTVSLPSIMYVTAYALKDDEALERDWTGFEPGRPFRLFSLKPGLGLTHKCIEWWTNYVYNDGEFRSGIRFTLPKRNISSCIPVGVKRHIKEDYSDLYEELKAANSDKHAEVISRLAENVQKFGSKRLYALAYGEYYFHIRDIDPTPDNEIKAFRKACRELAKRQRKPLK